MKMVIINTLAMLTGAFIGGSFGTLSTTLLGGITGICIVIASAMLYEIYSNRNNNY